MEKIKISSFKDLIAWKKGHELVLDIYGITKSFPREEQFGLASQMRRCAVSITSNIAEGFSRRTYKDKSQFYAISLGSVTELQNQLQISFDVGYILSENYNKIDSKLIEMHKIINGLYRSSRNRP